MRSVLTLVSCAGLAAAHGQLKEYIIDGTVYQAFDGKVDVKPKFKDLVKRVDYGFSKGGPPVDNVRNDEITCRTTPLIAPAITAPIRAGASITFKWQDWFTNHKGPVLTYMGYLPTDDTKPQDVDFFQTDEATYDPKTITWGTDWLIEKNDNYHTATIPSDIKPGNYIIRHEIIALHNSLNDNYITQISGAQFCPQCVKVKVLGDGIVTPSGGKFPGLYKWDDKGILINIYYMPNEYISPGGPVYKPKTVSPPKGPVPVVTETGVLTGEIGKVYAQTKAKSDKLFEDVVHADSDNKRGGGGCHWPVGTTNPDKDAICVPVNPDFPAYVGHAQPKHSPAYVDDKHANRETGTGPLVTYLFDPTAPRLGPASGAKGNRRAIGFEG